MPAAPGSNTFVFLLYCEIFKNNYFEEHLRTAASKVRINQKWNYREQVFCKKGNLKYFLNLTGKHLYWSLFLNEVTRNSSTTLLKRDMIIIRIIF